VFGYDAGWGTGHGYGLQSQVYSHDHNHDHKAMGGRTNGRLLRDSDGRVLLMVAPEIEFKFEFGSVSDFAILRVCVVAICSGGVMGGLSM